MHTVFSTTPKQEHPVVMSVKVSLPQMGEDRETLRSFLRLVKCEDVIEMEHATVELRFPLSVRADLPSDGQEESHPAPDDLQRRLYSECKESSFLENAESRHAEKL